MAGRGPAPKDPSRRARNNKDPNPTLRLEFQPCTPPDLPRTYDWHPQTVAWWKVWQDSPMAEVMGPTDWSYLLDTALMHHAMWEKGAWTLAAEVRLRVAQFGATPADRMRLRVQWADADDKDAKIPMAAPVPDRRAGKYGQLRALPTASAADKATADGGDESA